MLSPLADSVYRRLFAAQLVALFGTGLTTIALALLAHDIAGGDAGQVLGTALAIKMIAYVGTAPVAGAFAHLVPRRALLIALDLARAGVLVALPFVDAVWQIYVLIFVLSACAAAFTPVFQATIPDVLRDEARYTRALSLSRLAYDLENLASPSLAALLLTFTGYHELFAANAVAFVCSAALLLSARLPAAAPAERTGGTLAKIGYGTDVYLRTRRLRGLLLFSLAAAAGGAMVIVNTVVYVRTGLGGSESDVAAAMAAFGVGSMVAALALPRLLDRISERPAMAAGTASIVAALAAFASAPPFPWLFAVWFLAGMGSSLVQTPTGRLLRRSCHDEDRPAVFAAHFALSHGCWLIAYPVAGWAGAALGLPTTALILAALAAAAGAGAMLAWPAPDPLEIEHEHPAIEHSHYHVHDAHHQHDHEHGRLDPAKPHAHPHRHAPVRHRHPYVIDLHHRVWP